MNIQLFSKVADHLLNTHFGIGINDTWLSDTAPVTDHIRNNGTIIDAINGIVEEHDLDRIDDGGRSQYLGTSPLLTDSDYHAALIAVDGMFSLTDDVTHCHICGSRTHFDEINDGKQQLHVCLGCGNEFIAEDSGEEESDDDNE